MDDFSLFIHSNSHSPPLPFPPSPTLFRPQSGYEFKLDVEENVVASGMRML